MWMTFALICAFFTATTDALNKQLLTRSDERVVGWGKLLLELPWLLAIAWIGGWPRVNGSFWAVIGLIVPLDLVAFFCYLRAIRSSAISLVVPFLALSPLLTIATGWLLLGEKVTLVGVMGILAVTAGAYLLHLERAAHGILEPFKEMVRVPGIRGMLAAAALYSVAATLGKRAIQLSSPTSFPFLLVAMELPFLTWWALRGVASPQKLFPEIRKQFSLYLISSLVAAVAIITHSLGIVNAPVAYFIAIKRLSIFVSVLYGGILFREASFPQRVAGTSLMLTGAILITVTT